jgi:hypothetical protein
MEQSHVPYDFRELQEMAELRIVKSGKDKCGK